MNRKFLVVVRAGDSSLHPGWLQASHGRDWDLVVSYCGADPYRFTETGDGVIRIDSKGPRWQALAALLSGTVNVWQGYEYVWLPEDDLEVSCEDINLLFRLASGIPVQLAQPSLTADSLTSQILSVNNPSFAFRYSSFIDPVAPLFSRDLLRRALPTFAQSPHGSGLDCVWPRLLSHLTERCAILDRIQVRRTEPLGGLTLLAEQDTEADPRKAKLALLQRHGIVDPTYLCFGGFDNQGQFWNLFDSESEGFISRLCTGYLDTLQTRPGLLGRLYIDHALARRRFLAEPARVPERKASTDAAVAA